MKRLTLLTLVRGTAFAQVPAPESMLGQTAGGRTETVSSAHLNPLDQYKLVVVP